MTRPAPRSRNGPHRRRVLRWCAAVVALALAGALGVGAWFGVVYVTSSVDTVDQVVFDRPIAVPPLAPSRLEDGVRVFDLTLQRGESDLGQGSATPTWGINGDHLGPTLRVRRGEQVRMEVTNDLGEATTLHWHGMHLPAEMDGGPHQMIEPGSTWTPAWEVDQPAASLWYHPHPHGSTASHVYRGLAGMLLVDDAEEAALALPRTYGVDDFPVIVQDRSFHDDGTLDESASVWQSDGVVGDTVLVNGTPGPYLDVTTRTVRLRLLNAANTRPYAFAFDDGRDFAMIASDGGLLEAPVELDRLQLSPGERAEVVVAVRPGERVRLQSGPSDTRNRLAGGTDRLDILELRAGDDLSGLDTVPTRLVDVPRLAESAAASTRDFDLSGFAVNGEVMDMSRIDEVVTLGDTEVWSVENVDGMTHNFHVHDVRFQVLDIDGEPPPAHLAGWKDTVWLPQGRRFRLIMTFSDHASEEWPYMFHCHVLRHEDQGLMGQFLVVEPERSTRAEDYRLDGHHHASPVGAEGIEPPTTSL